MKKKLIIILLFFCSYCILSFFYLGVLSNFLQIRELLVLDNIAKVLYLVITLLIFNWILHKTELLPSNRSILFFSRKSICAFFYGIGIAILAYFVVVTFVSIIRPEFLFSVIRENEIYKLAINSFLTSVFEEIIFRGFIFYSLYKIFNKSILSIILSIIIFSSFHMFKLWDNFSYLVIINISSGAIILSILYVLTRNLWSSIGFHYAHNIFSNIIQGHNFSDDFNYFFYLCLTIIYGIFSLIAIYQFYRKKSRIYEF